MDETEHKLFRSEFNKWILGSNLKQVGITRHFICGCKIVFDGDESSSYKQEGKHHKCNTDLSSCTGSIWHSTHIAFECGCRVRRSSLSESLYKFYLKRCEKHLYTSSAHPYNQLLITPDINSDRDVSHVIKVNNTRDKQEVLLAYQRLLEEETVRENYITRVFCCGCRSAVDKIKKKGQKTALCIRKHLAQTTEQPPQQTPKRVRHQRAKLQVHYPTP